MEIEMKVIKRDGREVEFDKAKISNAIYKAFKAVGEGKYEEALQIADEVTTYVKQVFEGIASVEQIQDIVEEFLIKRGYAKAAKAYILYRKQHQDIREFKKMFMDIEKMVDEYLGKQDWRVNENSNMSYSLQGLNNHISSSVTAYYWLNKIYPKEVRDAHINGDLHIHDLGLLSVYCCGWDLRDLLLNGFTGVEGKVQSKPPKHFRSALGQIVNFFYTLQGEAAGAQAFSNFDTYLAPFVYYDNLSYEEVKQAIQEFIFNLNVPTRVGFQTPFTNITMDLVVPEIMKDEPVIIGGKVLDRTYKEFQKEMDMINMAFAEVMMEGDAKGRIFTFPIPTYNITKNFDWDSPVVNKVMEMTARYGLPYFSNFVNSDLDPNDVRSMCCRLRLDNRELRRRGGGLFGANPLTGSIGVVTINM
ncbi:MAG: ribonucleoside triphosphate reductase, partial [Caldanaerobacter sp.]